MILPEEVTFATGSAEVNPGFRPALRDVAQSLRANPNSTVQVVGHTDNVGQVEDLLHLSEDRAIAVKVFLIRQGVAADRIHSVGYGPKYPINNNSDDDLRSLNRRVEVVIIKI